MEGVTDTVNGSKLIVELHEARLDNNQQYYC